MVMETTLNLYRKTIKRLRPAHRAVHWLVSHSLIPYLEARHHFKTMPDDPFWFRLELLTQRHEPESYAIMRQAVQRGMTVLDVGAHVGYYTRLFSQQTGTTGRVFAFEPHPRNFQVLQSNLQTYANVQALQVAVGEQESTAQLHDYLMMSASGSLNYDERLRNTQQAQVATGDVAPRLANFQPQTYSVRVARLDDLLAQQGVEQVDFIKMDIEGAEMGALRGAQATIARSPRLSLVMEYNPLGLQAFGVDPVRAIDEILAMGFQRVQAIESDGQLTDYSHDASARAALCQRLIQNMGVINLYITK